MDENLSEESMSDMLLDDTDIAECLALTDEELEILLNESFSQNGILEQLFLDMPVEEKPYSCFLCNKSYAKKNGLISHCRIHAKEVSFTCKLCKKKFSRKVYLKQHCLRVHVTPCSCIKCNKNFSQKANLASTRLVSTKEKPFSCEVCYKQFTQRCHLNRHQRSHIGARRFPCNICNKTFFDKARLVDHHAIEHNLVYR